MPAAVYAKADQPAAATADADRAMAWLTKAVAAGYANAAHMAKDTDPDPLRDRPDFRRLVADLTAQAKPRELAPPPRPVSVRE